MATSPDEPKSAGAWLDPDAMLAPAVSGECRVGKNAPGLTVIENLNVPSRCLAQRARPDAPSQFIALMEKPNAPSKGTSGRGREVALGVRAWRNDMGRYYDADRVDPAQALQAHVDLACTFCAVFDAGVIDSRFVLRDNFIGTLAKDNDWLSDITRMVMKYTDRGVSQR